MRLRYKPNARGEIEKNPLMILNPKLYKGKWKEVFGNDKPIHLEIGSGKGDFVKEMALRNPDINFLALEINIKAFVLASRKFNIEEVENVRGIVAGAEDLEEIFESGEISKIYLNFSTPWPKRRHHKRRLTHKNFLDRYKKIIKPGASLELKTDNRDFFDDTLIYLEENNIKIIKKDYNLSEEDSKVLTEYERKFRKQGLPICFVKAKFL
ncbi:MAG: tRNA (guanosine(46)-N7)-methyltransferase TrmB [Peptoniphilaceae bacterium]|nr:tRNA (guanosine(46)-N7)-methyltransferase TrmB [Peptoniphilaceae bacterium]MDY6018432.1 tRNA (guanosine(46)-N7)-methyltransferase TrmB [Anaerococcus sp.]